MKERMKVRDLKALVAALPEAADDLVLAYADFVGYDTVHLHNYNEGEVALAPCDDDPCDAVFR